MHKNLNFNRNSKCKNATSAVKKDDSTIKTFVSDRVYTELNSLPLLDKMQAGL